MIYCCTRLIHICSEVIYPRNFPPDARTTVPNPSQFPNLDMDDWEELMLDTPDGEKLHAYLIRASNKSQVKPVTVLMFHGNAGNIGHRVPIAGVLEKHMGVNVFMLEYRGYGKSTGTPDEKGLNIDAQTALDFMRKRPDIRNTRFVIYGQSLGGAVSINLVAKNQNQGDIKALILENTFLSIRTLIPRSVLTSASHHIELMARTVLCRLQDFWRLYAINSGQAKIRYLKLTSPLFS